MTRAMVVTWLLTMLTLGAAFLYTDAPISSRAPITAERCEEDEPCWDCSTMGNLVCGRPTVKQAVRACYGDDNFSACVANFLTDRADSYAY